MLGFLSSRHIGFKINIIISKTVVLRKQQFSLVDIRFGIDFNSLKVLFENYLNRSNKPFKNGDIKTILYNLHTPYKRVDSTQSSDHS